uniref:Uncharacterized protein n=1 Tax=marine sediment metagenome TaxID=412755 RepID=A0A0F9LZU9_9ZZZZ
MIRSCEDVETLNDFYEFARSWHNTRKMGLKETTNMTSWGRINLIDPELFFTLQTGEADD